MTSDRDMTDLTALPWRVGRTLGRTVYARTGGDDWKADTPVGMLDTRELAEAACADHNAVLDLEWLAEAGFNVELIRRQGSWRVALSPAPDAWKAVCGQGADIAGALAGAREWAEGTA
jgi:hypothetical protein